MKMSHLSVLTASALMIASQCANADSLFRPRASLGFAAYDLSADAGTTSLYSSSYMTLGFGATVAVDEVYFDIGVNNSLSAEYDNDFTSATEDFSRQDTTLTIGLSLDGGVSIFGGYKTGSTEYTNITPTAATTTFDTDGLFFGAGISMPVDQNSLSFSGAVAFMNGKLEDNDTAFTPYNEEADTVGLSLAMGYNINLSENSGMAIKGAYQFYGFTNWSGPNAAVLSDYTESVFAMDITFFANF